MVVTNQLKNQHLLWRAGFGPMAEELDQLANASQKAYYQALAKASRKAPTYLDVADNFIKGLSMGIEEVGKQQRRQLSEEERRKVRQQSREDIKSLNLTWLNEMVNSEAQLREKMSLFWHGHFASRNLNILYQQQLLDVIRRNALGNFGTLLKEVSQSAAMINFLNNNQNRKDHPNENFAREVMELFTMGRGHYTEKDIKEAARAFTGWGVNLKGEFTFRKQFHDYGQKTVLGKSGNLNGDEVLDILLDQKQTARYITTKVYRYFVNEQVDADKIEWLSSRFYQSSYDIGALMQDIFTSDWFYSEKNIGTHIKSPVELLVGIRRIMPMELENEEVQLLVQRLLGQVLFYPPNVAGWPGGKSWIDSSSLMFRLRLPQLIQDADEIRLSPKSDDDQMMGMADKPDMAKKQGNKTSKAANKVMRQQIQANINWNAYIQQFAKTPKENLVAEISKTLLQVPSNVSEKLLMQHADTSSREAFIKTATVQLMATPEYQLC
ncbi:MAG TPA: DUF1800 domain-containing protein [Chitinophagaceae bacterium]|nr:DUF1800 domain-containing protein [Chitinophagaceae bacterium]